MVIGQLICRTARGRRPARAKFSRRLPSIEGLPRIGQELIHLLDGQCLIADLTSGNRKPTPNKNELERYLLSLGQSAQEAPQRRLPRASDWLELR